VVAMEDGYEQTLFQGRGKTMHRRRRNDRLIFFMSQKKRELLYDEMDFCSNWGGILETFVNHFE
jgi:hypothetical protein